MLRSFTLKNFRCFQNLTLEPLERVNLIGGKNNVGKTSLLEAIFIFINPNSPEPSLQVNRIRSIAEINQIQDEYIEGIKRLFFEQNIDSYIEMSGINENNEKSSLKLNLVDPIGFVFPILDEGDVTSKVNQTLPAEVRPYDNLVLEYSQETGQERGSSLGWYTNGRLVKRSRHRKFPLGIYLTTSTSSPTEDAKRFSNLERVGRHNEVLEPLRLLEPRLQRLTLLVMDKEPIIYGDIGMSELVPLPLMGEGIGRLLSIILAIANAKGGTILIDEIENGLHYSVLTDVWKAIADASRRADTQIFATTHSLECIKAAHEAFDSSEKYDFRYHRLERVNDEIRAVTYDQENLAISDEMNLEMR
jgi:AAA15 family ATPase/GTPase